MIGKRDLIAKLSKAKDGEKIGVYYEESKGKTEYGTVHKEDGKYILEKTIIKHE